MATSIPTVGPDPASFSFDTLMDENSQLRKTNQALLDTIEAMKREEKSAVRRRRQEKMLKPYQAEVIKLQRYLELTRKKMVVIFEGRDAAGKGGTIRRLTRYMNVKHYRVVALGKPSEVQRTQWFFQRYVEQLPRGGEMVLFDRSWYNRAIVEPVFGFCTPEEYLHFMDNVTDFEKNLVKSDTILLKLYFSVTKAEQERRFERRKTDPLRQWKLSEVDLQAQERWDDFSEQKYKMLKTTHTPLTPWTVIRSDDKHMARLNAVRVILNAVPYEQRNPNLDFSLNTDTVISGAREIELMEAERIRVGRFSH
ncbi:MAG: polyphosphate kinase 2 [Magnetococcus sp. WYHC-3]